MRRRTRLPPPLAGQGVRATLAVTLLLGAAGPPPGAASCSGCHSREVLPINGQSAAALSGTMLEYRSGKLSSTLMGRLMKPLTTEEITAIAAWVAEQGG